MPARFEFPTRDSCNRGPTVESVGAALGALIRRLRDSQFEIHRLKAEVARLKVAAEETKPTDSI